MAEEKRIERWAHIWSPLTYECKRDERGGWVKHEDHALIASDLQIELELAENARQAAESRCKGLAESQLDDETLQTIETALIEWGDANCSRPDFTECGDPFCRDFAGALVAVSKARSALEGERR